jgi:geranylgeranyl diphosphate synthase type I
MTEASTDTFKSRLKQHKQAIDADIAAYVTHLTETSAAQYGDYSKLALQAYCEILARGGKRLRGALVIEGYTMSGGTNMPMIMQAARAIEMVHAYLLITDDIQDRSLTRRGGPTAHVQLANAVGDEHLGETLATNAALLGNHAAMMILANLDAPPELRSNVLSILNRTLVVTVHGQIADPMIQYRKKATEADVLKMQEWKTATYTMLNPLHVGMVLAGAGCEVTDGVTPFAMAAGQAFQITDDIIGMFGDEAKTGKGTLDDIREGKQTLLMVHALAHANPDDRKFLLACLGDQKLTPTKFKKCQEIVRRTGALEYAQTQAKNYCTQAVQALHKNSRHWSAQGTEFLQGMADYLLIRSS